MTIHELLQAAGLTANDEIPIWDADGTGEPTKKITAQQLAAAVVALANLVTSVNNQTGAVSITPANIGSVAKTGDTMTGPLTVQSNAIALTDTAKGNLSLYMHISGSGDFGIYSNGYYNGSSFIPSGRWLVYRDTNDVIRLGNAVPVDDGGTGATTPDGACANIGAVKKGSFTPTLLYNGNPAVNAAFTLSDYVGNYNILRIVDTHHYYCDVYMPVHTSTQTIMANGSTSYPYDGTPRFVLWEFTAISSDGINYTVARKAQANITPTGVEAITTNAEFGIQIYGLK